MNRSWEGFFYLFVDVNGKESYVLLWFIGVWVFLGFFYFSVEIKGRVCYFCFMLKKCLVFMLSVKCLYCGVGVINFMDVYGVRDVKVIIF